MHNLLNKKVQIDAQINVNKKVLFIEYLRKKVIIWLNLENINLILN